MILTQDVPREIQKYLFSLQVETSYVAFVPCSRINKFYTGASYKAECTDRMVNTEDSRKYASFYD